MVLVDSIQIAEDEEGADKSNSAVCVIKDCVTFGADVRTLKVVSTTTGHKLLQIVGCAFNYKPDDLVLVFLKNTEKVLVNEYSSNTVEKIGLICDGMSNNFFDIRLKNSFGKSGGRRTICTTETVEIQKTSKGSRTIEKTCTTSVTKTNRDSSPKSSTTHQKFRSVEPTPKDFITKKYLNDLAFRNITDFDRKSENLENPVFCHGALKQRHPSNCDDSRLGVLGDKHDVPIPVVNEGRTLKTVKSVSDSVTEECSLKSKETVNRKLINEKPSCEIECNDLKETVVADSRDSESTDIGGHQDVGALVWPVEKQVQKEDGNNKTCVVRNDGLKETWPVVNELPVSEENSTTALEPQCYVGLVNQAMTCYLNSLLQTLYMTPEFRNALYRWEFDCTKEESVKNIPFQLQKLFLQLQMSKKHAIGTTELTTSFGWDGNEAWQQHDVQELCRVMFDALEKSFKKTDQADLISRLYEGKMKDYVKCLECGYESAREDTFLDIPLVVRPFGATEAYGSVEEALRAFVAPETLVETNQYFCERCDKKCDAHKGLKFMKFPYLLTLHLKRFDFDPFTMNRIKLNDKVTFPQVLNLNEFVKSESEVLELGKLDIMMDSGSGFEEDASFKGSLTPSRDDEGEIMDVDEGIDVSLNGNHDISNDDKNLNETLDKLAGPFIYDLFSIMVHSGSANGGHYYAYIKSFTEGNWYSFNDVHVTKITDEDICKTYGGAKTKGRYSSSYSNSANAYMLMYRQIDKERNTAPMEPQDFPPYIKSLLVEIKEMEKKEQEQLELEKAMCKVTLFCIHPTHKTTMKKKLVIHKDTSLADTIGTSYELMGLNGVVSLDCCRLVLYDSFHETVERSLEDSANLTIGEILGEAKSASKFDLLLEIKKPDEEFVCYKAGGITVMLSIVDLDNEDLIPSVTFRSSLSQTVQELKQQIAKVLDLQSSEMGLVLEECRLLTPLLKPGATLAEEGFTKKNKVFVEYKHAEESKNPFENPIFKRMLDIYEHTIFVTVNLPIVDKTVLTSLGFPANSDNFGKNGNVVESDCDAESIEFLEKQVKCDNLKNGPTEVENEDEPKENGPCDPSNQQGSKTTNGDHSENSSLSSLTDSERTLVGDEISPRSNSPMLGEEEYWDAHLSGGNSGKDEMKDGSKIFFKAVPLDDKNVSNSIRVYVDTRITLEQFKKQLEPFVGVGADFFKLYRVYSHNQEVECTRLTEDMASYSENSTLAVKLGKALQKGEYKVKVYQLLVNDPEPCKHLVDWVFVKGMTVLKAKKELLSEVIARTGYNVSVDRLRLRKKNWKNPGTIFLDSQKFEVDIAIFANWEVFLEVLPEPERVTSANQLSVFLRVWHPATFQLSLLTEIVLNEASFEELKLRSSEVSGIPAENLEFTKGSSTFPCEMFPLTMQTEMEWHSDVTYFNSWPLYIAEDGCVLCCRDKTEELKELTEEEKKEFSSKENLHVKVTPSKPYFSPHKERALKIYTESPVSHTSEDVTVPSC